MQVPVADPGFPQGGGGAYSKGGCEKLSFSQEQVVVLTLMRQRKQKRLNKFAIAVAM